MRVVGKAIPCDYRVKEHKKLYQKPTSEVHCNIKSDLAFCLGPSIDKTNSGFFYCLQRPDEKSISLQFLCGDFGRDIRENEEIQCYPLLWNISRVFSALAHEKSRC